MTQIFDFAPDGLHLPTIKAHSCEKIGLHNHYAATFTAGMKKRWPNLVYIGLYSGAGAATVEGSDRVIMTSALSVLTQPVPFTRYIFVDRDQRCIDALKVRAERAGMSDRSHFIPRDVNGCAHEVLAAMPDWRRSGGVLTFCFIDPYKIDMDFEVVRSLGQLRIDVLLMIPLGYDIRRNWRDYVEKPLWRERLSKFLGESDWIDTWSTLGRSYQEFPRFVQGRMGEAMRRLGFIELDHRDIRDVKIAGKNVYLYSLHLFSKSEVAIKFWRNTLKGTSEQHTLDI